MSNMKFAIRKLAIACVLPTALWQGPLTSDAWAQNFPTANSKVNAGMPQKRMAPTKKAPPAGASANDTQPQFPATARPPVVNNSAPVYQVANPAAAQQQQQGNGSGGGETDVQKQLRLLYEKSGQEMPVMDLSEMEVPEPQAGVAPEGPQGGPNAGPRAPGQFAQPPVPPQKAPNFFERVFLGKKSPPPQVAPQPRAPMGQQPIRTPNGAPAGTPPATNYRPYQPPGLQVQPGQPALQPSQSYNGQRPGTMNQPGATAQPNGYPQQQAPQLQLQRPQGQPQVIPPQPYGQVQQPQQPQLQLPQPPATVPQQIQNPPQYNPQQPAGGAPQVVPPQAPTRPDEVPFLDEEPEESLEIDLNPKPVPAVQGNAIPGTPPSGVIPAPLPTATATPKTDVAKPAAESDPAPTEENPFSGLRLSIPEAAAPTTPVPTTPVPATPVVPSTPAAGPALTPSTSPAANATLPTNPVATPPAANSLPKKDNPFLDDEDVEDLDEKEKEEVVEKTAKPVAPPAAKVTAPPITIPALGTNKPLEISPIMPPGKSASPASKTPVSLPKKVADEQVAAKPPLSAADERLRKLADAPEKTGLKGFCPVALRQKGQLLETKPQFNAVYQGQKFHFSSIAAKVAFEKEPQLFVPVHAGLDGVALVHDEASLPGSLDHAVWYQGHLYLFANRENREIFVNDPELYLNVEDVKQTVIKAAATPEKPTPTATRRPQKTPRAAETEVAAQPAVKATTKTTPSSDELPVLSDNLDDLPPLLPVTTNTPEPAAKSPAARTPALTPVDAGNAGSTTREAPAPVAPKPAAQPAVKPPAIQPGPQLDSPMQRNSTKNTPASFVVPTQPTRSPGTPPRLISPDLRLAPPVRQ
ncbi:MAG: hypothetical protein JWN70_1482 [Planctomycetaceae bacterium]|nr:hypothetical protein [Planctomycetaceae bacterium]